MNNSFNEGVGSRILAAAPIATAAYLVAKARERKDGNSSTPPKKGLLRRLAGGVGKAAVAAAAAKGVHSVMTNRDGLKKIHALGQGIANKSPETVQKNYKKYSNMGKDLGNKAVELMKPKEKTPPESNEGFVQQAVGLGALGAGIAGIGAIKALRRSKSDFNRKHQNTGYSTEPITPASLKRQRKQEESELQRRNQS